MFDPMPAKPRSTPPVEAGATGVHAVPSQCSISGAKSGSLPTEPTAQTLLGSNATIPQKSLFTLSPWRGLETTVHVLAKAAETLSPGTAAAFGGDSLVRNQ